MVKRNVKKNNKIDKNDKFHRLDKSPNSSTHNSAHSPKHKSPQHSAHNSAHSPMHTSPQHSAHNSAHSPMHTSPQHSALNLKHNSAPNPKHNSPPHPVVISGEIKLHRKGFGFVKPDDPSLCATDVFIPRHLTEHAVDGDIVEVEINPIVTSEKGPEGRVITILKRGRTHIAGTIVHVGVDNMIIGYAPMLGPDKSIIVKSADIKVVRGDRVIMEVLDWGSKSEETVCRVTHHLGHISDPSCDIPAAVEEFGLRSVFPSAAIEEAKHYGLRVSPKEIKNREDLRHLECITIDPDTAKDFDDALNISRDANGDYHLGVHIADVSHYVTHGTAIDVEAKMRSNSTYFPGKCVPMLPPELSENLCSLKPNVNRLTASVLVTYDSEGNVKNYRITRSVIKSRKRFTYKEAKRVLDGQLASPHADSLNLMVELCLLLKKKRAERGALEFAMPDMVIMVDDKGVPVGTEYVPYDITHQLVEEFMLMANETIATHLSNLGKDLTYRIHEEPAEESMAEFSAMAYAFGFRLPESPTSQELQALFDEALKTPYGHFLATNYIRRMKLAIYSGKNIGHFGLRLTHYCHFTSPIRRYVDLVVHRILFGDELEYKQIEEISTHCSQQERISEKAENSVVLLKKLRLLEAKKKTNRMEEFEAVVTQIKPMGIIFELTDYMLQGFLHLSELEDDYYELNAARNRLEGRHTGTSFFAGDRISLVIRNIDLIAGEATWNYVGTIEKSDITERVKIGGGGGRGGRGGDKRNKKNKVGAKSSNKGAESSRGRGAFSGKKIGLRSKLGAKIGTKAGAKLGPKKLKGRKKKK